MILLGRAEDYSRRRRLVLAGAVVLVLLLLAGAVTGVLHGFGDGLEEHGREFAER